MTEPLILHASCIACESPQGWAALLILGPSGAGKSRLALEMIALGARLVSDDRTALSLRDGRIAAAPPAAIAGLIEARGLGLLRLPHLPEAPLAWVADMGAEEHERLPPPRTWEGMGEASPLPLTPCAGNPAAAAALTCLLRDAGARREA